MSDTPTLTFLGAAGTVTGSKYLVHAGGRSVLLDCGMFQGLKDLRLRNWNEPPFDSRKIDAVVLSHAHINHSGCLPLLAPRGFRGPIFCTPGTADLLHVLLLDAAHLQEEEAETANRYGYSKHKPALPLYTVDDANAALRLVHPQAYEERFPVTAEIAAILRRAGHILGSASVELQLGDEAKPFRLVSSGDLGRPNQPILRDAEPVPEADVLLVESTYGDRVHPPDPASDVERVVNDAVKRGGALLVPAFAVDRTQELIWMLRRLEDANRIPTLPVYLDSPMAIEVTAIYCRHLAEHNIDVNDLTDEKRCPLRTNNFHITRTPQESKALNHLTGPMIIISANGMATGGRVVHHLKMRLPDPRNTVLLVGYQADGTRGRALQDGASTVRIQGQDVPVRAKIEMIHGLSAHADREEILQWLSGFRHPPRQTYVVHGEPQQAQGLVEALQTRLHWQARVARDGETVTLA